MGLIWNFKIFRNIMYIAVAEYMEKKDPKDLRSAVLYLAEFDIIKL